MLETVWRRARESRRVERWIVATDDERIADACAKFGAEALLTDATHPSGTDRVAEVSRRVDAPHDAVLNVQGDEPLLTPTSLDRLVETFDDPRVEMATLAEPIGSAAELFDPNVVKVVVAGDGRALYFSRSPIPYHRGVATRLEADFRAELGRRPGGLRGLRKHQGLYAYRRETLQSLARLPPSPLERDEGLEQLRALEAGMHVVVADSDFRSQAVDTPADLERVSKILTEAH